MGTRMKSKMPKVLHKVCGKPLSKWVIDASKAAGADKVCAVVGHKAETVKEVLGDVCEFALQAEQKGTGHAVMQAIDVIKNSKGEVVILNGDTPLITAETINKAIEYHKNNGNQATVITAILDDATGYGRIVRDNDGSVLKIVEQKDASEEEKKINEVKAKALAEKKAAEAAEKAAAEAPAEEATEAPAEEAAATEAAAE